MMVFLVHILELGVLAGFGLMAGAVIYSSVVEIPVRQGLDARGQLMNWQSVFPVASGFLKPFGIGLFPFAIVIGFLSGVWLWFVSALLLIAVQPFTALFIAKTNKELIAFDPAEANEETSALIRRWDQLHHVRTCLITQAFACALFAGLGPI